jgi:hypothetical protein
MPKKIGVQEDNKISQEQITNALLGRVGTKHIIGAGSLEAAREVIGCFILAGPAAFTANIALENLPADADTDVDVTIADGPVHYFEEPMDTVVQTSGDIKWIYQ